MKTVQMFVCDVCQETSEDEENMLKHEAWCLKVQKQIDEERAQRAAWGQLTIGQLLEKCKELEAYGDRPVVVADEVGEQYHRCQIRGAHSYRGNYSELSLNPVASCQYKNPAFSLRGLSSLLREAANSTYTGWKGGDYRMNKDTFVWISEVGVSGGLMVTGLRVVNDYPEIQLVGRSCPRDR